VYHLEAAIAYEHAIASSRETTNFARTVERYDQLMRIAPSPVVALNRAISIGEVSRPEVALAELMKLSGDKRLARCPTSCGRTPEGQRRPESSDAATPLIRGLDVTYLTEALNHRNYWSLLDLTRIQNHSAKAPGGREHNRGCKPMRNGVLTLS
jgi:hypothetical protein